MNFLTNKLTKGWLKMKKLVMVGMIGMVMLAGSIVRGAPSLKLLNGKKDELINLFTYKGNSVPITLDLDGWTKVGPIVIQTKTALSKVSKDEKSVTLSNKAGRGRVQTSIKKGNEIKVHFLSNRIKVIIHKIKQAVYTEELIDGRRFITVHFEIVFKSPDKKDLSDLIVTFSNPNKLTTTLEGKTKGTIPYAFDENDDYQIPRDLKSTWNDDVQTKKDFKEVDKK